MLISQITLISTRAKSDAKPHSTGLYHSTSGRDPEKILCAPVVLTTIPMRYPTLPHRYCSGSITLTTSITQAHMWAMHPQLSRKLDPSLSEFGGQSARSIRTQTSSSQGKMFGCTYFALVYTSTADHVS